jgi:hypothetical protein
MRHPFSHIAIQIDGHGDKVRKGPGRLKTK